MAFASLESSNAETSGPGKGHIEWFVSLLCGAILDGVLNIRTG
jgi:hypothetical protein